MTGHNTSHHASAPSEIQIDAKEKSVVDALLQSSRPVFLRPARAADLPYLYKLEIESYPADEAASEAGMAKRCREAGQFFWCLCLGKEEEEEKEEEEIIIGFVNGTLAEGRELLHESMSEHFPHGSTLVIHSVTISPSFRRRGLAHLMLSTYVDMLIQTANSVSLVLLLSKAHLLQFYRSCGFEVLRLSPVVHGQEHWFELSLDLESRRLPQQLIVDAFSDGPFSGNPAGVVFAHGDERWMQGIAAENNLAETSFLRERSSKFDGSVWWLPRPDFKETSPANYDLRWFTPTVEVELCGHATLAAAHALYETGRVDRSRSIHFHTIHSGILSACSQPDGTIQLSFPATPVRAGTTLSETELLSTCAALGVDRSAILFTGRSIYDVLVELTPEAFGNVKFPVDLTALAALGGRGVIITCAGQNLNHSGKNLSATPENPLPTLSSDHQRKLKMAIQDPRFDFVSRFFAPLYGVNEDPVTGSAHCYLFTHWASRKVQSHSVDNMRELVGYQCSARGGIVQLYGAIDPFDRVLLSGSCVTISNAKIHV